jgi:predicted hydrolase (HD superfamily)
MGWDAEDSTMPTRDEAWALLREWTTSESLRRHGLAVEAAVAWYGEHRFGVDATDLERWRMAGLLHDFDYERFPESHPVEGAVELRRLGYSDDVVDAVMGHGDHTGHPRTSDLAHTVYACDEMSGFLVAVALVRPGRSLAEVDVPSVRKKMKDKGFARQVPRDQLEKGAEELGLPLDEHVENVLAGLRTISSDLGL